MRKVTATIEFVEKCRAAASVEAIGALLFAEMSACGIAFVALSSHVDPLKPPKGAVMFVNYPKVWVERFSERDYARRDPVFWAAGWAARSFWWNEMLANYDLAHDQKRIVAEAEACGVAHGMTIPIHSPGALPASCSIVPGMDGIDPLLVPDLHFIALHAHEEARLRAGAEVRPPPILSKRQRECLALAAHGKSDFAIGAILGISPRTVEHTIESARRKFGVSHRTQAVALAIIHGLLTMTDLSD